MIIFSLGCVYGYFGCPAIVLFGKSPSVLPENSLIFSPSRLADKPIIMPNLRSLDR